MSGQIRWRGAVALIAAGWGGVAVIVQAIDLPATAIVFYRVFLAASALLAGALLARRLDLLAAGGQRWPLLGLGAILGAHWLAYFVTIKVSSVALAVLLVYTGPLFIAVLAPPMLGAPTGRRTWLALAAGAAGIALVATDGAAAVDVSAEAVALGLVAGLMFALLIIAGGMVAPSVSAPSFAFWETAAASLLLFPVALSDEVMPPNLSSLLGLLALGVGATALLGVAFARTLRHVDAQSIGVLLYIEPVSSVLLAWLLLSQQPSPRTAAGGGLVLAAGMTTVWITPRTATLTA